MKKIVFGLAAVLMLAASPSYAQHYYRGGSGGGWVGPLVGGAIVGGVVGSMLAAPGTVYVAPAPVYVAPPPPPVYVPTCWQEFQYYDIYNRPVYRTVCR